MNSPIKWVGGKRREIKNFEKYIPKFDTYVEPFFGGGALFWHLTPANAEINDINSELVNFYEVLRDNPNSLFETLQEYILSKEFFDNIVDVLNSKSWKDNVERAAIFYYINKTCFSGKWRVNKNGKFNSSYGYYTSENFKRLNTEASKFLNGVKISSYDYRELINKHKLKKNSFVFLDPPYLDCDTFYTESQEFKSIYEYIKEYMDNCECKVMLVVKANEFLEKLFSEYIVDTYDICYAHNSKSNKSHKHLVICNY